MSETCPHHAHPELATPIDKQLFRAELGAILLAAGLSEEEIKGVTLEFPRELEERHKIDPRAYAEIGPEHLLFRFAPQALALPEENRLGLICHEVGHLLDPPATENGADRAVERQLGVRILYDPRWPGKGLQRLEKRGSRNRPLMR